MKKNRLSHSSISTLNSCGEKYRLHYIEKIRPITKSAAFITGLAVDNGLNSLLLGKDDYLDVFYKTLENDDEIGNVPSNPLVRYSKADLQEELLEEEDKILIQIKLEEAGLNLTYDQFVNQVSTQKYDTMEENIIPIYNLLNWLCIRRKGPYYFESYKNNILPNIKKVHTLQHEIKLINDEGDELIGFADIVVDHLHTDGKVYKCIADNKTSSIPYKEDSVSLSQQLSLYAISEGIEYAVYYVIQKKLKKIQGFKCSNCDTFSEKSKKGLTDVKCCDSMNLSKGSEFRAIASIVFDKITEEHKESTLETVHSSNLKIKEGNFEKNPKSCWEFGGCPYRNLCWKGSMDGLKKKEEK